MTKRVWRLLSAMIVATLVVAALSCSPHADAGINITAAGAALTAMAVLSWGVLALCNAAMQPVENQSTTAMSTTRAASSAKCRR